MTAALNNTAAAGRAELPTLTTRESLKVAALLREDGYWAPQIPRMYHTHLLGYVAHAGIDAP